MAREGLVLGTRECRALEGFGHWIQGARALGMFGMLVLGVCIAWPGPNDTSMGKDHRSSLEPWTGESGER